GRGGDAPRPRRLPPNGEPRRHARGAHRLRAGAPRARRGAGHTRAARRRPSRRGRARAAARRGRRARAGGGAGDLLEELKAFFQYLLGLGAPVLMPMVIFVFGLVLRQGFSRSLRAGLIVGIGFVGIHLVVGLLVSTVGPQARACASTFNANLDVLDVGWPIGAGASFAYPISFVLFPSVLLLNVVML